MSSTSEQCLLMCVVAIDHTGGLLLGNISQYAVWGIVNNGADEEWIRMWACL